MGCNIGSWHLFFPDQIADRRPDSVLFVATITPMSNPTFDERARAYNELIAGLILEKQKENRWVLPVDMYSAGVTLADGVHPNRAGYDVVAEVWINAILGLFPWPCPASEKSGAFRCELQ